MSETSAKTISFEAAREALKRAMETQGEDFLYTPDGLGSCWYLPQPDDKIFTEDDPRRQTGCLVGTAARMLGVSDDRLTDAEESSSNGLISELVRDSWQIDFRVKKYFSIAQRIQDDGDTWGNAYRVAEKYAQSVETAEPVYLSYSDDLATTD